MNKSLLIKQNNELFDKIRVLKSRNAALLSQVANLGTEIEDYKAKILALESEIELLKNPEIINDLTEEPLIAAEIDEPVELSDDFNFASDVIGDIVIKAAGYINKLTESSNENKKELINLILGRTEIAKAEILNAVSSEVTFTAKKDLINTQYNEAIEYFKSIMEQ